MFVHAQAWQYVANLPGQGGPDFVIERDLIAEQLITFEGLASERALREHLVDDASGPGLVFLVGPVRLDVTPRAPKRDAVHH